MTTACPFRISPTGRPIADAYDAPLPPPTDADEDVSVQGLLAAARAHLADLFSLFGAPADLAQAPALDPVATDLLQRWVRNLEFIVRQLVVAMALGLIASGAVTAGSARRQSRSAPTRASVVIDWSAAPETWRATLHIATRASPRPARRRRKADVRPSTASPEALRTARPPRSWARRAEALRRTLREMHAAARRQARRMLRAMSEPMSGSMSDDPANASTRRPLVHLVMRRPPPFRRPDGSYNPLSRKALFAFWRLVEARRGLRPDDG